jgi:nucleotide-binding universal stress UspA family protein
MNIEVANRPPAGAPAADSNGPHGSRANVVVLLERPDPAGWSIRQLARLARRLGADLLVAAVVTYDRSFDDLDRLKLEIAQDGVQRATARLVEEGVRAAPAVRLVGPGDQVLSVSDLADHLDADLVIVLARRGSWFRLFPGSPMAHQLMRLGRRPVLVIPDRERRGSWPGVLLELVRIPASRRVTGSGVQKLAS